MKASYRLVNIRDDQTYERDTSPEICQEIDTLKLDPSEYYVIKTVITHISHDIGFEMRMYEKKKKDAKKVDIETTASSIKEDEHDYSSQVSGLGQIVHNEVNPDVIPKRKPRDKKDK